MPTYEALFGTLTVEITTASQSHLIKRLNNAEIDLYKLSVIDEITLQVTIARKDIKKLKRTTKDGGDILKIIQRKGIDRYFTCVLKRPVLLLFISVLLFLTFFLPSRVLFLEIEGEWSVDKNQILSAADGCGIGFGSKRSEIRSEMFKNKMLQALPELQWLGINTRGCVAVISVKERADKKNKTVTEEGNCIVAAKSGVVRDVTIRAGFPMCQPGDPVEAGQLLVSGWVELENYIRLESASGEVYADTECESTVITPINYAVKKHQISNRKKYSILIGKKLINLYKGSGIYGIGCDRIYKIHTLTLPGGYKLPFSVIVYSETENELETELITELQNLQWMGAYSRNYQLSQMSAGTILETTRQAEVVDDIYVLCSKYRCNEMIGKKCNKEFTEEYGKRN